MQRAWYGLRLRMALTYVGVTVLCLLLLEIVLVIGLAMFFLDTDALRARVEHTATHLAGEVVAQGVDNVQQLPGGFLLGNPQSQLQPGAIAFRDNQVEIPFITTVYPDERPVSLALLVDPAGTVVASSYPGRYPPGSSVQEIAETANTLVMQAVQGAPTTGVEVATTAGPVLAAVAPLRSATTVPTGFVYVHVPIPPRNALALSQIGLPVLLSGLVLLIITAPVGLVFGLIATRGLIHRLQILARATTAFAEGDFSQRVPVRLNDEIGQLEQHFNEMADQVKASLHAQRNLAAQNARLAERSRISRELHDSISQDLFSLRMLVGGLHNLPGTDSIQEQLTLIEQTLGRVHHEMRALLLELRPHVLEQQRLKDAIATIADTYAVRLGIRVHADLQPPPLTAHVEQALLRIAQEGIANAVRHANANQISLSLLADDSTVVLHIADDGVGFEPSRENAYGLGLRLMRERAEGLGGTFELKSSPGTGTQLLVRLPVQGVSE